MKKKKVVKTLATILSITITVLCCSLGGAIERADDSKETVSLISVLEEEDEDSITNPSVPAMTQIVEKTVSTSATTTTTTTLETTTIIESAPKEYVVYKPSTHYIHKSTCHWVTSECYKIEDTKGISARQCTECCPEMEIINEYEEPVIEYVPSSTGCLTKRGGVFYGPSGKEKYYNLTMSKCIDTMRRTGEYPEEEYPVWVRQDGVKMFGEYVMCAMNIYVHPLGDKVDLSLGKGIVVDHCPAAVNGLCAVDIAVTW